MCKNIVNSISWAFFGVFCLQGMSNFSYAMDLSQSYLSALSEDGKWNIARAERDAQIEKGPQGLAGVLPKVELIANERDTNQQSKLLLENSAQTKVRHMSNDWSLQLRQPLIRWQNVISYRQGLIRTSAAEVSLQLANQELIVRVAQAYFDVVKAQEAVSSMTAQQRAISDQLESAKHFFKAGRTSVTDIHEAQSRYDLTTAQLLLFKNELKAKLRALGLLVGRSVERVNGYNRTATHHVPVQLGSATDWMEIARSENLRVKIGALNFNLAEKEYEKQRAGHYPTLDLIATHGVSRNESSTIYGFPRPGYENTQTSINLQLNIPIFSGGATSSQTREALAIKQKIHAELVEAQRAAEIEAQNAYDSIHLGEARLQACEAALTSSLAAVESNKLGYAHGLRVSIDVLNAQAQLYSTYQKVTEAKADLTMAQLRLKAAVGQLTMEDIQYANQSFKD